MATTTAKRAIIAGIRAVIYLRLSDLREHDLNEDGEGKTFADREAKLRELADRLGWTVTRVVIENDVAKKSGKHRPVSAFKRKKVTLPDGSTVMRVWRPKFRSILDAFRQGRENALLAEDLDRTMRDPRDLEDFIDVAEAHKINARSLAGSLTFSDGGTDAEITMARVMVTMANKSSRDTSRRVADGRRRKAENGEFGGGRRPFGFEDDGKTVRPAEADVIADCSKRVLQIDVRTEKLTSLRLLAAELREGDVPTVTGAPWSSETLRDILLRPRNAGIMVYRGKEIGPAPWKPIVPVDVFRAVVGLLTDPTRIKGPGRAPRWQGSGIYLCGNCDDGTTCEVTLGGRKPRYKCKEHAHLARSAEFVDKLVDEFVVGRLSQPDAVDLIPTVEGRAVDVAALRAEAAGIRRNLESMAADRVLGRILEFQMVTATRTAQRRLEEINQELADNTAASVLAPLIGAEDVAATWEAQPLSIRREVINAVCVVTILPSGRQGPKFDPSTVDIIPKEESRWTMAA